MYFNKTSKLISAVKCRRAWFDSSPRSQKMQIATRNPDNRGICFVFPFLLIINPCFLISFPFILAIIFISSYVIQTFSYLFSFRFSYGFLGNFQAKLLLIYFLFF